MTDHTQSLEIVDPKQEPYVDVNVDDDDEMARTVKESWQSIKTFCKCHSLQDVLNIRMWDPVDEDFETTLGDKVAAVWKSWPWSCKINLSVGCVLTHKNDWKISLLSFFVKQRDFTGTVEICEQRKRPGRCFDELTSMDLAQKVTSL